MSERPRLLGLLLTEGFALMSYASVIEPFRAANRLAGAELYRWTHISPDGAPVHASSGAGIVADHAVGAPLEIDTLFVFAGGEPSQFAHAPTFAWLRRLARRGAIIAGVSGGPYLLARAGLLDGHRTTIHWEHRTEFEHGFPRVRLESGLYVVDRRRMTCAGGTAAFDLCLDMIEREQGRALARRVADWFIKTEQRDSGEPQRRGLSDRYGVTDDRLLRTIARMESHIETPVSRGELAQAAGVSLRQLERLFARQLGFTVADFYRSMRLAQARELLSKTDMPVIDIALATGFLSSSHFSRAFSTAFKTSPRSLRQRRGG